MENPSQGLPLGYLAAWHLFGADERIHPSRQKHMGFEPTYSQRIAGRRFLAAFETGRQLMRMERFENLMDREEPELFVHG